jgi:actin-related protein
LFPGFAERLEDEARDIRIDGKVDIIATPERKFATWIGGSMLTELSTFKSAWITKSDYEEHGPSIAHIKCE